MSSICINVQIETYLITSDFEAQKSDKALLRLKREVKPSLHLSEAQFFLKDQNKPRKETI